MTYTRNLPQDLYTASQVQAMDRYAIQTLGIPGLELMRRAGAAAFLALRECRPEARTLSAVCGAGNNGGDAYVVARLAHEAGWDVRAYPAAAPEKLKGDALTAYRDYLDAGGALLDFVPVDFEGAEVLVDGLFGTGLDRAVEGLYAEIIGAANRYGEAAGNRSIVALDLPSGLHADTGLAMGVAVKADLTVSFIGLKQGLFTGSGLEHAGEVVFSDLDTPPEVKLSQRPAGRLLPPLTQGLPRRPRDGHKGRFGHVLVIGGEMGYSGAARLAGEAALRVGAGLVSIATRPEHASVVNSTRPELMCHGVRNGPALAQLIQRSTVVAIGPGLGQSAWAQELFDTALSCDRPLIVDADALNLLAARPLRRDRWVLTPHPGEAGRLLGVGSSGVQADRFAAVRRLQARFGGVAVLKGSGTLIYDGEEPLAVSIAGNPGMASGGMGDVLTGVIAGLVAQDLSLSEAARLGVQLHGTAGDEAAKDGERGLLAGDLMAPLRRWVNA